MNFFPDRGLTSIYRNRERTITPTIAVYINLYTNAAIAWYANGRSKSSPLNLLLFTLPVFPHVTLSPVHSHKSMRLPRTIYQRTPPVRYDQ